MDRKPKKGEYLEILLRAPQTVFSTKDVAILWMEEDKETITRRLRRYELAKKLLRVYHGFYAKDANYNRYELATKIYTPAYVSFETVLTQSGISFQFYGNIFVASYLNKELVLPFDGQRITFVRMKDYVLSNTSGIERTDGYSRATKERAFLDRIYVSKDYHFDNLRSLDWEKVFELLPIYHNKRMEKKVKEYFEYSKALSETP